MLPSLMPERAEVLSDELEYSRDAEVLGLLDRAFIRATGSSRIEGNRVRILRDAAENFNAWLDAIATAQRTILFESYLWRDDEIGQKFASALAERARDGVSVYVVYDWLGSFRADDLWAGLRAAGAKVRVFNPFAIDSPLGWVSRDHRKSIAVDGRVGFVTGVCISAAWLGDAAKNIDPWRDTGIEIRGPAVAELEEAFADVWKACGGQAFPKEDLTVADDIFRAGDTAVRVIAGRPSAAGIFRLDQLIASAARKYLWLTDAYFVGVAPYVQALCSAARDGVDVRLLVPGVSDIAALKPLSRTGYRPLLAAGVKVYEWNGSMLHAKSAVADGLWARVGSTNLNFASFIQNWELDVAIEDPEFAEQMAEMYQEDLTKATEIVLTQRNRVRATPETPAAPRARKASAGSASRAAAGALSVGNAMGAALTNRRVLGPAESGLMMQVAVVAIVIAVVAFLWPRTLAYPLAFVAAWFGIAMIVKAWGLRQQKASPPAVPLPKPTSIDQTRDPRSPG
jgi:cardiolipin synthase